MRDIIPSLDLFPVKKLFCKFDISGDTKDAVITNKHAVIGGASNFFEVITLEIDVPLNIEFSPVLTVYAYDNLMGFLGNRLVGVTNIPLEKHCKYVLKHMNNVVGALKDMPLSLGQINVDVTNKGDSAEKKLKNKFLRMSNNKGGEESKQNDSKNGNAALFDSKK